MWVEAEFHQFETFLPIGTECRVEQTGGNFALSQKDFSKSQEK